MSDEVLTGHPGWRISSRYPPGSVWMGDPEAEGQTVLVAYEPGASTLNAPRRKVS